MPPECVTGVWVPVLGFFGRKPWGSSRQLQALVAWPRLRSLSKSMTRERACWLKEVWSWKQISSLLVWACAQRNRNVCTLLRETGPLLLPLIIHQLEEPVWCLTTLAYLLECEPVWLLLSSRNLTQCLYQVAVKVRDVERFFCHSFQAVSQFLSMSIACFLLFTDALNKGLQGCAWKQEMWLLKINRLLSPSVSGGRCLAKFFNWNQGDL